MRCKECGSKNISMSASAQQTSSYSWGKGLLGTLVFGAPGAVAGVGGKTKSTISREFFCMACGNFGNYIEFAMDAVKEQEIDTAIQNNDVVKLEKLKKRYKNIEWTPTYSAPITTTQQSSLSNINTTKPILPLKEFEINDNILIKYNGTKSSVVIPDSVISIGKNAFLYCRSLTSITIPNSVKSIEKMAFRGCKNLTSITIPNSVKSIGESAFNGCEKLTSIVIPNGVKSIGKWTFFHCDSLTSVTISDGIKSIGDSAFFHCDSLTSIIIPESIISIKQGAFQGCQKLNSVLFQDPHGWKYKLNGADHEVDETTLSDPKAAAELIKNFKHATYLFKKSDPCLCKK